MGNPLVAEDLDNINEALQAIVDARDTIKRARLAGMDMNDIERRIDDAEKRLTGIKQGFFPNGRP